MVNRGYALVVHIFHPLRPASKGRLCSIRITVAIVLLFQQDAEGVRANLDSPSLNSCIKVSVLVASVVSVYNGDDTVGSPQCGEYTPFAGGRLRVSKGIEQAGSSHHRRKHEWPARSVCDIHVAFAWMRPSGAVGVPDGEACGRMRSRWAFEIATRWETHGIGSHGTACRPPGHLTCDSSAGDTCFRTRRCMVDEEDGSLSTNPFVGRIDRHAAACTATAMLSHLHQDLADNTTGLCSFRLQWDDAQPGEHAPKRAFLGTNRIVRPPCLPQDSRGSIDIFLGTNRSVRPPCLPQESRGGVSRT